MKNLPKIQASLFLLSSVVTPFGFAADNFSSTFNNKSKQNANDGFYLVRDKAWAEEGCILDKGKDKINPGENSTLKIKQECAWGVITYKVFNVKDNKEVGNLGHSFRDGKFYIEVSAPCNGSECNFYDLNPNQNRK